ncbi:external alternative NAD(P)H-ubiquinone oxidoreductase B1 [Trichophyton mentagrophytes]|uniref:External NADH-ubiquinone oxidoreductase n=1 Tax=Trichophyton interdigitale TaxID=101480 RepID=A0A9P4YGL5_9EURO|nr:External NADH-ubiquinone oxidoreductase [Trichophyton interdigitale]KAF3897168.1 External NADH-ubiquinone oxidoreductase [Trichophyton interdigitale]KAG8208834.1 External NADH-ubiquinone oxidoreductase [Trichophyton interdigitale]GBF61050.1 external alternative NAD(P)H-ubiquinone oxidoreductase B1 [Trichophyton mentagrophytes]
MQHLLLSARKRGYQMGLGRLNFRYASRPPTQVRPTQQVRRFATLTGNSTGGSPARPTGNPSTTAERVVILGSGWGGYTLSRKLSAIKFSPTVISPRSYFVFTPLLTDAAIGSLDFSEIVEPVRDRYTKVHFIQAAARAVDFNKKTVTCEASVVRSGVTETTRVKQHQHEKQYWQRSKGGADRQWESGETIMIPYDKLVVAVGCVSKTFNTPGVRENALFLKDVGDARRVKRRIRECFELAVLPNTDPQMQRYLLHFAIVGAGPTGIELAASLCDFIHEDLVKVYPQLKEMIRITLFDVAPTVLSTFDESLSKYAMDTMEREGVDVKTDHHIESLRWGEPNSPGPHEMDPKRCLTIKTKEDGEEGIAMCVWATGNEMNEFVHDALGKVEAFPTSSVLERMDHTPAELPPQSAATWSVRKAEKTGALLVDDHLRVRLQSNDGQTVTLKDVFAIGDNCMLEKNSPPATAQSANQEAIWLAKCLNANDSDTGLSRYPAFSFRNLGMIAYVGHSRALMQFPQSSQDKGKASHLPQGLTGYAAWLVWKGAYLSMSISWRNRLRILYSWISNRVFGRDISRY